MHTELTGGEVVDAGGLVPTRQSPAVVTAFVRVVHLDMVGVVGAELLDRLLNVPAERRGVQRYKGCDYVRATDKGGALQPKNLARAILLFVELSSGLERVTGLFLQLGVKHFLRWITTVSARLLKKNYAGRRF